MGLIPFGRKKRVQSQPEEPVAIPRQGNGYYTTEQVQAIIAAERERQQQQITGAGGRSYPLMDQTKDERYLEKILDPHVRDEDLADVFYAIAGDAAVHLSLTNIPDPHIYQRLRMHMEDLFLLYSWSANDYFKMRQLKLVGEAMLLKSIGYTKNIRERDALITSGTAMTMRDDRASPPRESGNILAGFLNR
jgi:hypothetical protein